MGLLGYRFCPENSYWFTYCLTSFLNLVVYR